MATCSAPAFAGRAGNTVRSTPTVAWSVVASIDVAIAGEFGLAVAIARGTPSKPLCEPENLYHAKIVEVSEPARKIGIEPGMTGLDALAKLLTAH